jgi:anti-sigma factor RsiW
MDDDRPPRAGGTPGHEPAGRICREVRVHLAGYVADDLPRWRRRLLSMHLRRCAGCATEATRQRQVAEGLRELAASADEAGPPADLLGTLLEQAADPGVRGRAAVPARGAVSGARPGLSAVLLVAGAAAGTGAGYAAWRAARAARRRISSR